MKIQKEKKVKLGAVLKMGLGEGGPKHLFSGNRGPKLHLSQTLYSIEKLLCETVTLRLKRAMSDHQCKMMTRHKQYVALERFFHKRTHERTKFTLE